MRYIYAFFILISWPVQGQSTLPKHSLAKEYSFSISDQDQWNLLASNPSKTHFSQVSSIKLIIDKTTDSVYFIDSKTYTDHYIFARQHLKYRAGHRHFIQEQYMAGPKRYLYPMTLNYFKSSGIFTLEFFSGDEASCEKAAWAYRLVKARFFNGDNLRFYATNDSWSDCTHLPTISTNEIYHGQSYQALNIAESYGYLTPIKSTKIPHTAISPLQIILTDQTPIDIPVVAGIITAVFQTPLSHINVLSHNRKTPNMALKEAFTNPQLLAMRGKLVHLIVQSDSFAITESSLTEAQQFWDKNASSHTIQLSLDTTTHGIINLSRRSIKDVNMIGGKAANFAEMIKAQQKYHLPDILPENHFAIPFYYYYHHLHDHNIDSIIQSCLGDSTFLHNSTYRKKKLKYIRESIISAPVDPSLISLVNHHLKKDSRFTSYKFRSSTNAEDIEDFNGAGLYNSYKFVLGSSKLANKIKRVWASLWNFRAFEERSYFHIDHQTCAMGILVHRSFPDEDANGVIISKNLFNMNHGFIVNVQYGEVSVVQPPPGIIQDQIILYDIKNGAYIIEYNTTSNLDKSSKHVLTDTELRKLAQIVMLLKKHFYYFSYQPSCAFKDFALDIEFKIDSTISPRQLYIKQVRLY